MIILGTNSIKAAGSFNVDNSLRFNSGSSDYLTRTPGSASNQKTFTISFWIKRSASGNDMVFSAGNSSANSDGEFHIGFTSDNDINVLSGPVNMIVTNRVFRDVSAWYHIVVAMDTTQGTASNRAKLYVNGVQETSFSLSQTIGQNDDLAVNKNVAHDIGRFQRIAGRYYNGYLSEFVLIDGSALAPDQFGEFDSDSGIWKPKDVSGLTFGTNGFYLEFKGSGTSANSSGLGADTSGNTHHFAVNNLTAVDQSTDTCTNNFATLNPLDGNLGDSLFTEGNLKFDTNTGSNKPWSRSTIGVSSGKWYFEAKLITAANNQAIGISDRPSPDHNSTELGAGAFDYSYQSANSGDKYNNGSQSSYGNTYGANDIVSCALDLDNLKVYFGKNGTFQNSGNPTNGTNPAFTITAPSLTNHGFYFFCLADLTGSNKSVWEANFGSPPFAISSGNTDGNGFGNFEYAVPSGYFALNTKNLSEYG